MRGSVSKLPRLVAAASVLLVPAFSNAGSYTFIGVADTSGDYAAFLQGPVINDFDEVGFEAVLDTNVSGIYTGPNPVTDVLADDAGGAYAGFGEPSINNSGVVSFPASLDAPVIMDSGLFTGPNPATDTIADTLGPYSSVSSFHATNDAGVTYFKGTLDGGGSGIFSGPSPLTDTVIDESGPYSLITSVMLNDVGGFAFNAVLDTGDSGIFTGPDPLTDTVATAADGYMTFGPATINDAGDVAWNGFTTGAALAGVFTGPDPTTDKLADSAGDFSTFAAVSLNDVGGFAFFAFLDSGGHGIFDGPDPIADRVIGSGDTLFGATVTGVTFTREGLNNSGNIVFHYSLDDSRRGVAIAMPEPGSLVMFVFGALAVAALRRR